MEEGREAQVSVISSAGEQVDQVSEATVTRAETADGRT